LRTPLTNVNQADANNWSLFLNSILNSRGYYSSPRSTISLFR